MTSFKEGSWFAVPLRNSGYAIGIAARKTKKSNAILGYFFGPKRMDLPNETDIGKLTPNSAMKVIICSDLHLKRGNWSIIANLEKFNRSDWPMPKFVWTDPISQQKFLNTYCEDAPHKLAASQEYRGDISGFEPDVGYGSGAIEIILTKLLDPVASQ